MSISFTASDSDSGVQDSMPTNSPLVINGEGMGLQVPVQATNDAGLSTGALSPPVNIDRTPPTVPRQHECYLLHHLSLGVSATDAAGGSGVATLNYGASGAEPMPSTSTSGSSVTLPVNAMGLTVLSATATDQAGNSSAAEQETVLVESIQSLPLACAALTTGFTVPAHGSVRLAGTRSSNGLTRPFARTIRY